jgi:hypothetical protein
MAPGTDPRVAIACENLAVDGEIYSTLLGQILAGPVVRWAPPGLEFNGWRHVVRLLPHFLGLATTEGVSLALAAIDNDGGLKRHPEHDPTHTPWSWEARPEDVLGSKGCRVCSLGGRVPPGWSSGACIVVPVQALETWLLVARDHRFSVPSPELQFNRTVLKGACWGKPMPHERLRFDLALGWLADPAALPRLRGLRSFQLFEAGVRRWSSGGEASGRAEVEQLAGEDPQGAVQDLGHLPR